VRSSYSVLRNLEEYRYRASFNNEQDHLLTFF